MTAEHDRLAEVPAGRAPWRRWGPYLSERAWGTVREDYSADGDAWGFFPHDHARSRAYRWNEDGLGGICDDRQLLCLALSFWNGHDPILKERIFGLTGTEGNHGEDAKEYWWFLDATPTHSWMRWRYVYPQLGFPYTELLEHNRGRSRDLPEYELVDTGVLDGGRYWEITADYAKGSPEDICLRLRVRNCGPEAATLHLLPTLWFRNTWSWSGEAPRPRLSVAGGRVLAQHPSLGDRVLSGDGAPRLLFCDNETNTARLWDSADSPAFPKDGINDHVVAGAATVNPAQEGTRAALWYQLAVEPGATAEVRLRLSDGATELGDDFAGLLGRRALEADQFYAALTPAGTSEDDAATMRQAFAGMLWSKQFYHYDVDRWLSGDSAQPPPPAARESGRNQSWRHLNNRDVISMPDTWEYPWYAAWDLAFHCIPLAHLDPEFAKSQLVLLCREWFMHPNGQLPAYEWNFSDVNPPVHAWAALRVFEVDGSRDYEFLERIFQKLLLNFTWWVNRKDAAGNNVFEGGFLGLDNIGLFDRSAELPVAGRLQQSDGTAWMASFCLGMLEMALTLAAHDPVYEDIATKFFEHFALIAVAMERSGLWDDEDGFYYDVISLTAGGNIRLPVRSMVGLIPLLAVTVLPAATLARLPDFARRMAWYTENRSDLGDIVGHIHRPDRDGDRLLSVVSPERLQRILRRMLDSEEFLSDHGLRSLSRFHRDHPLRLLLGTASFAIDYEPAESTTPLFGGNSNWRGPVWFPLNYLLIEALRRFHDTLGDDFAVACPTGSDTRLSLAGVADELSDRLVGIFRDTHGRRPVFGSCALFQDDPAWHDLLPFHEYFDGDTGRGLGASHQTGWTGLVAELIAARQPALTPSPPSGDAA
ncbi:MAG: glucosidase [Candidatus Dormibacteria bacterium]